MTPRTGPRACPMELWQMTSSIRRWRGGPGRRVRAEDPDRGRRPLPLLRGRAGDAPGHRPRRLRRVNGVISVSWQQFSVGKHHAGARVDVHVGPELLHVYLADTLIKTVVRNSRGEVRKKRASAGQLTDS